jgi:ATP-dependent helicase/nuclease subunit B
MRQTLELQAPERDIGLTAHDFVQAFGNANVVLTWAARLDGQPALPSRWILRLTLLLEAIGMWEDLHQGPWLAWVRELDRPVKVQPVAKPAPRPPREARPKRISVSRVEELIRDPYSIYARQVLRLEPLEELGAPADARLRGELIHRVLELYHREFPGKPPADIAGALRQIGAKVFAPHRDDAEIAAIWLPRFERIAQWFAEKDADLREGVREVVAECMAEHDMTIAGEAFKLTGRADRIDILTDGTARILDFKTGQAPGDREVEIGLAPQLTLEAALLARGQFKAGPKQLAPTKSREIAYLRLTGGEPAGEYKLRGESEAEVMAMAEEHLAGLQGHLTHYADRQTPYLPRRFPKKENYASPYDHLSRFGEWGIGEARE